MTQAACSQPHAREAQAGEKVLRPQDKRLH